MDEEAEYGVAAHWRYKDGVKRDAMFENRVMYLRSLIEWRRDLPDAREFVDALKRDVFNDRVYVFTPKGDIIDLPAGSTPIDFAYHVHTSVGDRCRGAKVNGKLVSLDYKLKTGEKVEIVTAKQGGPSRDWLNPDLKLVHSQRALQKIAQWFRRQDQGLVMTQGREILEKELRRLGEDQANHEDLARRLGYSKPDDMALALGTGEIHNQQIAAPALDMEIPSLARM